MHSEGISASVGSHSFPHSLAVGTRLREKDRVGGDHPYLDGTVAPDVSVMPEAAITKHFGKAVNCIDSVSLRGVEPAVRTPTRRIIRHAAMFILDNIESATDEGV